MFRNPPIYFPSLPIHPRTCSDTAAIVWPALSRFSRLLSNSPVKPEEMDWSELYPEFFTPLTQNQSHDDPKDKEEKRAQAQVEFADIGCGYGGLLGNTLSGQGKAMPRFCHLSRFGGGHSWPFPFGPDTSAVTSVGKVSTFHLLWVCGLCPGEGRGLPQMPFQTWVVLSGLAPGPSHYVSRFTCQVPGQ